MILLLELALATVELEGIVLEMFVIHVLLIVQHAPHKVCALSVRKY